jgi:hypothetical protein
MAAYFDNIRGRIFMLLVANIHLSAAQSPLHGGGIS